LVVPRRKTILFEAFHGRRTWPDFELHGWPWGSTLEREERGKGRGDWHGARLRGGGREGGVSWGGAARGAQSPAWQLLCAPGPVHDCCVRKKGKRRERKRKDTKREKQKERKKGKIAKPGNFRGEK
jgi:hypothetical protein